MKLKDLSINIFSGGTPSTTNEDFWNGEFYWLSSGETKNTYIRETEKTITKLGIEKSSTRLAKVGDVVVASAGQGKTRGQVAYCLTDTYINQSIIAIRAKKEVLNSKYLFYNLSSRYNELRLLSDSSSSRGSLTVKIFEELNIDLPEIEKQNKIAKVLSNYDDLIENNNKRIKILEEMAQKIYKEWFVDFKFPNHETATFKQTELGKIPTDWNFGTIKDINDVKGGYAFKSNDLKETGEYGVIKIKNIQSGDIDINSCQYINERIAQKAEAFKLSVGDLLIAMTGAQVGKVGMMPKTKRIYYLNQRVGKFIPNKDFIINNQYLSIYTRSEKFNTQINNVASGAAQPNISTFQIENIEMLIPQKEIIKKFEKMVNPLFIEILTLNDKNTNLKQTRDLLLPRLISGEINVENLEIL